MALPGILSLSKLFLLIGLVGFILAILPVDQPRLFPTQNDWNTNLFRRVSDCLRDTTSTSFDTTYTQRLKAWASPQCNSMLTILNSNWNNTINGVQVLNQQEYFYGRIAAVLYGVRMLAQSCGISSNVVTCAYVTP